MADATWIRGYNGKSLWMAGGLIGGDGGLTIGYGGASPTGGGAIIAGNVGIGTTTPTYKLHVVGRIKTDNINETSDIRLKKDVITIGNALAKVEQLRGVYFNWRTDEFKDRNFDTTLQVGVIAQEIEKIFPEVVSTDADGYKSVEYSKLVGVLIEAIKEQQKTISNLKSENDKQQIINTTNSEKYDFLLNALIEKGLISKDLKGDVSVKTK